MAALVVPAAGRGSRFGSAENKIWAELAGRPVLAWALAPFQDHPEIKEIVIAGAEEELDRLRDAAAAFPKVSAVVRGGATRPESVGLGLAAMSGTCDIILVHDAARPCVTTETISRVIDASRACGAAVPGLPVSDTVKRAGNDGLILETVPRAGLWTVQTPQGARLERLKAAYDRLGPGVAQYTDEASVLEAAGFPVHVVEGDPDNLKVTLPGDLERARAVLGARAGTGESGGSGMTVRTGFGYDVHAFADGRPLWLGGMNIPHERGLAGHSDADVLLHAVCDALLGAASLGDIGVLFPDTDPRHKDRASMEFVHEVRRRLAEAGWRIENVDIALLAEEPRIGPYRPEMTAVLADGLGIAPTQVNLKATTSEKMGFVGRREGIACWAVATITRQA
jgi:2-C-methyl-D-erythritol 4-phosphate cytidylyltransferase/2-C-methyl-D-erythritol 2,4-cyclodiphosphate synthase